MTDKQFDLLYFDRVRRIVLNQTVSASAMSIVLVGHNVRAKFIYIAGNNGTV